MSRNPTMAVGWAAARLLAAAFSALGNWQLGRQHEKQAMLDAVHATTAARYPPALAAAAHPSRPRD